ncbi:neuronal acetylcholine receptor subunit alpha-10-like [Gigantopelta aegis]|uniref:neuronal acetylcholine receptor subunit alpha-10-like n=1 Tax=Gigantopelta aegis TaxID=1735272 RepID=UPI001B88BBE2|nr:neuronal acetylcholine receptor subunit alpha-10-like [Gigantopelta aegis]
MQFQYLRVFWNVSILWFLSTPSCVSSRTLSSEEKLHRLLLENYSSLVIPQDSVLNVTLQLGLQFIIKLDESKESLTALGWLQVQWMDFRLTWNVSLYSGCTSTILPAKMIWKPDLHLYNSIAERGSIANGDMNLKIMNDGLIIWEPGLFIESMCRFDVTMYPFDSQVCLLEYGSWHYGSDKLILHKLSNKVILAAYKENNQWEITNASVETKIRTLDNFSIAHFRLFLRRRRLFYVLNVVLPICITSSLSAFVFVLPPESGEKIGLSTTLFLTHAVLLGSISRDIPNTSTSTSILSAFVVLQLILSGLSIIITTIILKCYHANENKLKSDIQHRNESKKAIVSSDSNDVRPATNQETLIQGENTKSVICPFGYFMPDYQCCSAKVVNCNTILFCVYFVMSVAMALGVTFILIFL